MRRTGIKYLSIVIVMAVFVVFVLTGLVGAADTQPQAGGTLRVAWIMDATQLDPFTTTAHYSHRIFELVYNTLVGLGPDLLPVPELAESWDISEDGIEYTFHLRKDVKFHNGQKMTSGDVAFTLQHILDENTGAIARSNLSIIKNITTPDAYTVVCELKNTLAGFLVYLTDPNTVIVSKEIATGANLNKVENVVGTGPFQLAEWEPDQQMVLKKNPNYFEADRPYLDEIVFRVIPEESSIVAALRTGQVDFGLMIGLTTSAIAIRQLKNVNLISVPSLRYTPIFINTSRPPLDNLKVRQAMNYAIGREEIINSAMLGEGTPTGPIPPSLSYWAVDLEKSPYYQRNVEKARELMKEAGFEEGFSVELIFISGDLKVLGQVQVVQSQLKDIGIDVQLKVLEYGIYVDRWLKADLDLALSANAGLPDPHFYLYRYFYSEGGLSFIHGHWSNDRLDTLLNKGQVETDKSERQKIYMEAQDILIDEAPFIWLVTGFEYFAFQDNVKGFTPLPAGGIDYLKDVWISDKQ